MGGSNSSNTKNVLGAICFASIRQCLRPRRRPRCGNLRFSIQFASTSGENHCPARKETGIPEGAGFGPGGTPDTGVARMLSRSERKVGGQLGGFEVWLANLSRGLLGLQGNPQWTAWSTHRRSAWCSVRRFRTRTVATHAISSPTAAMVMNAKVLQPKMRSTGEFTREPMMRRS